MDQDLKFIDTLDEEQRANLARVIDAANRHGVNPRLAAALAFTESQLRQMQGDKVLRGSSGEIGIMQIKPATGKLLGFNATQLMDPDANIDAGMRYLRQSIDKFGDPVLGAVGYNAGPDHPFFLGKGDPPAQSVDYVNRIRAYGGFAEPETQEETTEETGTATAAEPAPESDNRTAAAAIMGGLGGATLGTSQMAAQALFGGEGAAGAGGSRTPGGPTSPGQKWASKVTGVMRPGADTVVEAAQSYQRAMPGGKVSGPLAKKGFIGPGSLSIHGQPVPPPAAGPLARAAAAVAPILQSPVGRYGLAGAGVAGNAQEFMTRRQQEDVPGQVLTATGGLGSAMMMSRNPAILALGGGMAGASPLALAVLDRARKIRAEPPMPPATAGEMEEAKQPAFRYAQP
jgi:hypothetical protein